jgi:hypothetical protein
MHFNIAVEMFYRDIPTQASRENEPTNINQHLLERLGRAAEVLAIYTEIAVTDPYYLATAL